MHLPLVFAKANNTVNYHSYEDKTLHSLQNEEM